MTISGDLSHLGWLTITQYAEKHGVGVAWVRKLCKEGRLEGAQKAGGVWIVRHDAELPSKLKTGPRAKADPDEINRNWQIWLEKKRAVEAAGIQARVKAGVGDPTHTLTDRQKVMMGWIEQGFAMSQDGFQRDANGEPMAHIKGWTEADFIFWESRRGKVFVE